MGDSADPIAGIEDTTVRRFVRAVVHVRRFLPFYVTAAVFFLSMAVVPAIDGGGGTPASTAAPGGGAGTVAGAVANRPGPAARSTAATTAAAAPTTPRLASFSDADLDGTVDAGTDGIAFSAPAPAGTGGAAATGRNDDPVAPPDFDTPAEFPETPTAPEPCKVKSPSPAPEVDPARELSGGQGTAEAVLGQALPVDAGETVAPVSQEAICSVPESPVPVPSVPLPATPVAQDAGPFGGLPFGWLLRSLLRF